MAMHLSPDYMMQLVPCVRECRCLWRSNTLGVGSGWRRTTCCSNRPEFQARSYEGEVEGNRKNTSLSVDERIRRKRAELYQRSRKREPLEAELVVLFGSVAIILIIPWVIHDYRFIFILPAIVFVVPGLRGVVFQAAVEIFEYVGGPPREHRAPKENTVVYGDKRHPNARIRGVAGRTRRTYDPPEHQSSRREQRKTRKPSRQGDDDALIRVVKKLPLLRDWGGFL